MARTSARRRAAKLMPKPMVKPESSRNLQKDNDRISKLPNDILVNILDRLDFHDVARTSVLSRRWSQLPAKLSRLTISARDFLSPQTSISDDKIVRINAVNVANAVVVKATKSMLAHRDPGGCTIRLLSTMFYLRGDAPISIGRTVGNAMATHKVEKAEFTVLTEKERRCTAHDLLNHGKRFVSFFNECLDAFAGLTRLDLANLRFDKLDYVSNLLVTCKQLNYLGFFNCDTSDWITLKVEHAQLNELSVVDCRFDMLELTWVPKLTWLSFLWRSFTEPPLSMGYVPLLEVMRLSNVARGSNKLVKLSTLLHETSVRDLTLGFKCEKIWVQPECLTRRQAYVFQLLRIVNLLNIPEGYDLTWTMFFLEVAPSLEELYMTVIDHPCEMQLDEDIRRRNGLCNDNKGVEWESRTSNFKHHRLTKLTIFCFQSEDYMVSYVRRVMEVAENLEDVYLYDRLTCMQCRGVEPLKPISFPETIRHMRWMEKQIRGGIESLATIHFLTTDKISDEHLERIPRGH